MKNSTKQFLQDTGAEVPIVCGPMYLGANSELIAAVSEAGGFGVVQPVALTSLYKHDFPFDGTYPGVLHLILKSQPKGR